MKKQTEGGTIAIDHTADNTELKDEKNTLDIESGLSCEDDIEDEDEDEDHYVNNFRLKSSKTMIYQPFHSLNDDSQTERIRVRSKSSAQLLDLAQSTIKEEHDKLTSFVASLKAGDVTSKVASNFRVRRLTYENHGVDDCEGSSSTTSPSKSSPIKKSPVKQASIKTPMTSTRRVIRTTIFASSEIGHVTETTPPFPESMLGKKES